MSRLFEFDEDDEFAVVKNFFSEFEQILPDCINTVLNGVGYGNEYAMCSFPNGIEPDEEPFIGLRFSMFDGLTKVIDEKTFMSITLEACHRYLLKNPSKTNEIERILSKYGLKI